MAITYLKSLKQITSTGIKVGNVKLPAGCFPFICKNGPNAPLLSQIQELDGEVEYYVSNWSDPGFLMAHAEVQKGMFLEVLRSIGHPTYPIRKSMRIGPSSELFSPLLELCGVHRVLSHCRWGEYSQEYTGVWFGHAGNYTPFHHDWWHSFLIQIRGNKQFLLVHPMDTPTLQKDWTLQQRLEIHPPPLVVEKYEGMETAVCGTLYEGEILYIPPFWWHQVSTETNGNISVPLRIETTQTGVPDQLKVSQVDEIRNIYKRTATVMEAKVALGNNYIWFTTLQRALLQAINENTPSG